MAGAGVGGGGRGKGEGRGVGRETAKGRVIKTSLFQGKKKKDC